MKNVLLINKKNIMRKFNFDIENWAWKSKIGHFFIFHVQLSHCKSTQKSIRLDQIFGQNSTLCKSAAVNCARLWSTTGVLLNDGLVRVSNSNNNSKFY